MGVWLVGGGAPAGSVAAQALHVGTSYAVLVMGELWLTLYC